MVVRRKLGRGLESLLGLDAGVGGAVPHESPELDVPGSSRSVDSVPIELIDCNPFQPRQDFDPIEMESLVKSVQSHGVIQSILVRPSGQRYQIVAGERRFRAAKQAGSASIPARIVSIDDRTACALALVENLQRHDLGAIEKAKAFETYIGQFGATHEQLAEQLGVDRSTVTNMVRLLELPEPVQAELRSGKISFGHARALLSISDPVEQIAYCRRIIAETMSVREIESAARRQKDKKQPQKAAVEKSNHLRAIEATLRRTLGAKVEITPRGKDKGVINIYFESHDDFERIMGQLNRGCAA